MKEDDKVDELDESEKEDLRVILDSSTSSRDLKEEWQRKSREPFTCFKCKKLRHKKGECPQLQHQRKFQNKKWKLQVIIWDDCKIDD